VVEIDDPIEDLRLFWKKVAFRITVLNRETIDDVIGYCHQLELFKKPKTIEEILTPIIIASGIALAMNY